MGGVTALRKMQIGPEATAGTAVAATEVWRGPSQGIECLDEVVFVPEQIGDYGGANRTTKIKQGAQVIVPETYLTFEQFPWFCQAGVEAQQSGVADGEGSGKVYTFDFGLTAARTLKTLTIEAGNNQKAYEMEYGVCTEFTVRGAPGEGVMMSGVFVGQKRTATTFTSLSVAAVNEAIFGESKLYLDAAGGTMGNTQLAGSMLGFSVNVKTGVKPVFSADGELYFYAVDHIGWEVTADIVFRHITGADTEDANWIAQTARLLEIKLEGEALGTSDSYTYKTVRFQLPGKWTKFSALEEQNGNDILRGSFKSNYDTTASLGPVIVVVNEKASFWT